MGQLIRGFKSTSTATDLHKLPLWRRPAGASCARGLIYWSQFRVAEGHTVGISYGCCAWSQRPRPGLSAGERRYARRRGVRRTGTLRLGWWSNTTYGGRMVRSEWSGGLEDVSESARQEEENRRLWEEISANPELAAYLLRQLLPHAGRAPLTESLLPQGLSEPLPGVPRPREPSDPLPGAAPSSGPVPAQPSPRPLTPPTVPQQSSGRPSPSPRGPLTPPTGEAAAGRPATPSPTPSAPPRRARPRSGLLEPALAEFGAGAAAARKGSTPAGKVKASFNLLPEDLGLLRALAGRLGTTVTNVLERAIRDEHFIQEQLADRKRFAIVERDGTVREIIWR
jgi:hypothetical protein